MSRIFFDGFDHGSLKLWDSYPGGVLNSGSKVTGVYSLAGNITSGTLRKDITDRTDIYDVYLGLWIYIDPSSASGYFTIATSNGCYALKIFVYSSYLQFYVIGSASHSSFLGQYSVLYPENNIQFRIKNNQSSPLSVLIQIKVNGSLLVNETVLDGGYPYFYCENATVGNYCTSFSINPYNMLNSYIDDIVVDDADWPGPSRIYTLAPNGAGSSTMWQASSGDNHDCVDDIPENISDYVEADDALDLDLYTLEDLPAGISLVKGVQVFALAKTSGPPAYEYLQLAIRTSSVDHFSASQNLYYTYTVLFKFWETNPETGIAWTVSDINALEAGVRLVSS